MLKSSHQATNIIEKEVTFRLKTQRKRKNTSSNHDRLLLKPAKSQTFKKFNCELSVKLQRHYTTLPYSSMLNKQIPIPQKQK